MCEFKISVIIPVYNSEKHLRKCLDSVVGQTYKNIEILLIDDGSTDGSSAICDEYQKKYSNVICVHQENEGVSRARNVGMSMASGDYYHFLDSDDFLELDCYEYLVNTMHNKNVEAIGFEYFINYPAQEVFREREKSHYGIKNTKESIYEHLLTPNSFLCTKLFPSKKIGALRLKEDIYRDEDTLFGWQVIRNIEKMYFSNRPLLHYVQSEESACRGEFRVSQLSAIDVIPIVEEFLINDYPEFLDLWRKGYMHLMMMLYSDMYLDKKCYKEEQNKVKEIFESLDEKIVNRNVFSYKERLKFFIFHISPRLYMIIHQFAIR